MTTNQVIHFIKSNILLSDQTGPSQYQNVTFCVNSIVQFLLLSVSRLATLTNSVCLCHSDHGLLFLEFRVLKIQTTYDWFLDISFLSCCFIFTCNAFFFGCQSSAKLYKLSFMLQTLGNWSGKYHHYRHYEDLYWSTLKVASVEAQVLGSPSRETVTMNNLVIIIIFSSL